MPLKGESLPWQDGGGTTSLWWTPPASPVVGNSRGKFHQGNAPVQTESPPHSAAQRENCVASCMRVCVRHTTCSEPYTITDKQPDSKPQHHFTVEP